MIKKQKEFYSNPDYYEYRRTISPLEAYLYESWNKFYQAQLPKFAGKGMTVADLGCGTGSMLPLVAAAQRIYAVELAPDMFSYAKEKHQSQYPQVFFLHEDSVKTSIPDASCDTVLSLGVFCYVDETAQVVEIKRILMPGGHALITTPNAMNPFHLAVQLRDALFGKKHNKHFLYFRKLRKAFEEQGFTIKSMTSRSVILPAPRALERYAVVFSRIIDFLYRPLQSVFPIGSDIYLLVQKR